MRIPEILRDDYGKQPTKPLDVAVSLSISPSSGNFKMLTGAAAAYGLTDGAGQAAVISLTDLGRRIVAPTEEGQELPAMREAILRPRVVREFLEKYNGSSLPGTRQVALNVLETMGVPANATERAYEMIVANAEALGLLVDINGKSYVRLDGSPPSAPATPTANMEVAPRPSTALGQAQDVPAAGVSEEYDVADAPAIPLHQSVREAPNSKVFVTHGKNKRVVDQIRTILTYGQFEPVISVEKETTAIPVPDKVMEDMRGCGAAIVHVGSEQKLLDPEGNEHIVINSNVLIEIGAAMALYGRKFILLVERGVRLPSNLQGLYEVRYTGDELDYDATMKLLKALNDFR